MKFNKILVTGGAGFIGSHLVDALLARGAQVRVLDNFSTGKLANLPVAHPRLEIQAGDIRHREEVAAALLGMEAVVHLAAVASVQASVEEPLATHEANFLGTLHLLEGCRAQRINRFIYASSAAVYGDTELLPVAESLPANPQTPYAADKLAGEFYLDFYRRNFALQPAIFRFFNIYGPRQDPSSPYSGVISIFTSRILAGQGLTIFGDGEQTRDFVFVTDLVAILVLALTAEEVAPGAVNVGTGVASSLRQLISALETIAGKKAQIDHAAARPGDIKNSCADIARLQTRFGYRPATAFSAGLQELMAFQARPEGGAKR